MILHYNYRVDWELDKCVCVIRHIPYECPAYVDQLDEYLLQTITPSSQLRYAHGENWYDNKLLKYYNHRIIMKLLDNNTPKVGFDNINALVI